MRYLTLPEVLELCTDFSLIQFTGHLAHVARHPMTPSVASRQLPLQGRAESTGYGWRWKQASPLVSASRLSLMCFPLLAREGERGRVAPAGFWCRSSATGVGGWNRLFWVENTGAHCGALLSDKRTSTM